MESEVITGPRLLIRVKTCFLLFHLRKQQEKNGETPKKNINIVDKKKRNEKIKKLLVCTKSRLS